MGTKVCHLTTAHSSTDNRILHKECTALKDQGYDVTLLVVNGGRNEFYNGVQIVDVPVTIRNRMERFIYAPPQLIHKALGIDADIYHFHDPDMIPYVTRLTKKGKTVIYDAHEDVPEQIKSKKWLPGFLRMIVSWAFKRLEHNVLSKLSAAVTVIEEIQQRFIKYNPNTILVKNFPDLEFLPEPLDWQLKKRECCYIGDLTEIRGIYELVSSLDGLGIQLNLGGSFSENSLEDKVKALPQWKNVNDYGYVKRDQVKEILNRSMIGVALLYPKKNYQDALPVKIFEYMAAGLPVLASDFGKMAEIVKKHNCGLCVNPYDPESIKSSMQYLIEHQEVAQEMGQIGRKTVEKYYNWETEKRKLITLYSNLVKVKNTESGI